MAKRRLERAGITPRKEGVNEPPHPETILVRHRRTTPHATDWFELGMVLLIQVTSPLFFFFAWATIANLTYVRHGDWELYLAVLGGVGVGVFCMAKDRPAARVWIVWLVTVPASLLCGWQLLYWLLPG